VTLATAVVPSPAASAQEQSPLRIAIPADDGSLTPYTFESGYAFMSLVYDTLMWRDAKGVARPWLARTVRRNSTGRVVRVRLRPDVRWHDGRPLTARDVAFTYDFMRRRPHPRFTPELQDIAAVRVTGRLTLEFLLRRRALGFSDQPLADVPILPLHIWGTLRNDRRAPPGLPVGSGPYRLTAHVADESYRFDANSDYFRGAPTVARIDVPVVRRQQSILSELRLRRVDAAPVTVAPGTRARRRAGIAISPERLFNGTMLLFNVAKTPFRALVARRAVARSLDLDVLAGNATGTPGGTLPADRGMLAPGSPWSLAGRLHRFDPQAARLAFAEQGIGAFRIAAPRNDPVRLEVAERVVRSLTDAGARVRLVELAPRALDRALGRRGRRATFDAAVLGVPALASYDPGFLRAVFGDPRTAPLNDGQYRSSLFEASAERVASASSERLRRDAVAAQLRLLARELPAVPLVYGGGTFAYRPRAYDRWVAVRGTGILDKRSFLHGAAAPAAGARPEGAPGAGDLTDPSGDGGFSLVPVIVAFVVLTLGGALWWWWRRS
jgi:peptide/nickel transport system substrate-binding protein